MSSRSRTGRTPAGHEERAEAAGRTWRASAGRLRQRRLNACGITERVKVILFSTAANLTSLKRLRTVDDVCVIAFTDDSATDMPGFLKHLDAVDFDSVVQAAQRQDVFDGTFSVTISAARSPLGSAADLEPAVRSAIER